MIIAVFLDDVHMQEISSLKHIFLFNIEEELITAVGEELMRINDINYICLWLLVKRTEEVYCDSFSEAEIHLLERAGMITKPVDEIRNNPVLHAMLVKHSS